MVNTLPELAFRVVTAAQHVFDTLGQYRDEAIRAREATAQAELPRRSQAALRAAYASGGERPAPSPREALSLLERRGSAHRGRHLAPLGTAAVAVCALIIVVIVLAAPSAN